MRTTLLITAITGLFLSSCSTGNKMQSSVPADDLYVTETTPTYSSNNDNYIEPTNEVYQNEHGNPAPDSVTSERYTDENGTTYVTNNYYEGQNYDFYGTDNSYSSDLSRWYGPSLGLNYFSPFYTSPYFGVSLSFGFGWGSAWYNPYYSPWYYNPWYSPYYYGYYPYYGYNPYGYGSCGGYYGGYYGGSCYGGGYYGDSYGYGNNNYYYGSHGSASSNSANSGDGRHYKYGEDNGSGDQVGNGSLNYEGLSANPASLGIIKHNESGNNINSQSIADDIRTKPSGESVKTTSNGLGTVKSKTSINEGRNLTSPGNGAEIKSNDLPVRQTAPVKNTQENRPRTVAQSNPYSSQQHSSNVALNSVNHQQPVRNQEYVSPLPNGHSPVRLTNEKTENAIVMNSAGSVAKQAYSKQESQSRQLSVQQHSTVQQHATKSASQKASTSGTRQLNNSSSNRSFSQSNSSHSSSGNSRSSGSAPHR